MDGEVEQQRRELDELRAEVSRLSEQMRAFIKAQPAQRTTNEANSGQAAAASVVNRRSLLGRAAVVAAGGAGLALAGQGSAAAANGDPVILGSFNNVASQETLVTCVSHEPTLTVSNISSEPGTGLQVSSVSGVAVKVHATDGHAVVASIEGTGTPNAVHATTAGTGNAVRGEQLNSSSTSTAVYGTTLGLGNGVVGEQANFAADGNGTAGHGVLGVARGTGNSVFGYKPDEVPGDAVVGQADAGIGVKGMSTFDSGGVFSSFTRAQVRLIPSTLGTHPKAGSTGDLFVDANHRLWYCKVGKKWTQLA